MKRTISKKVSGLLATLLLLSVLLPALAFAAHFGDISYNGDTGSATGAVYLDGDVGSSVYVSVYDKNGNFKVINAVYDTTYTGTKYRYKFDNKVIDATYANYNPVTFAVYNASHVRLAVTGTVYKSPVTGGVGGGGVGGYIPTNTIYIDAAGKADATQLAALIAASADATLNIPGEFVLLPASALKGGKSLTVSNGTGSYTLPLKHLDLEALAKKLGVTLADVWIRVTIAKVDAATQATIVAATYGKSTVLTTGVKFEVMTEVAGKTAIEVTFGNHYAKRTININKPFKDIITNKSTGVLFAGGAVSFVPSTFAKDGENTVLTIHRIGNSIYTAVSASKTFSDISTHWGKAFIETLANKQVVAGYENGTFQPKQAITRAEFVSILVNALGVKTTAAPSQGFKDVLAGKWYSDAVNSALQLGLVSGTGNKTFKPNALITREEAAVIIVNALQFVEKPVVVAASEEATLYAPYKDKAKVSVWAKNKLAAAIKSGIVLGVSPTALKSAALSSRAEAVTMLVHFLENVEFSN